MRTRSWFLSLLSAFFFVVATFTTTFAAVHTTVTPKVRVTAKVNNSNRATLPGHVPAALRHAIDLGRINPNTPAQHLVMVLKSSEEQKQAIRRVIDEQQDRRTPNYHQWVTPEEFGERFGVHDTDIAKVSAWLTSQGFTVEDVSKSKRLIHFSGTTGNIENAFQTEMHSYQVGTAKHVSISRDITIPAALSPVIAGIPLSDFFRKSRMGPVQRLSQLRTSPRFSSGGTNYVGPSDFATIYNTTPLLAAGINGSGTSIAIVGRSDILLSDVQSYRQMFNLPINDPIFIHAGQENGIEPGDDGESDLDVEISGGIAPKAQVYFVIGTPTFLVDGITNSIEYIVENNLADIMSISYGDCESNEGAGGNEFNLQAFEQAAAQGISVFVADGDNGPAECDDSNDSYEVLGYAAAAEASTPYVVSAGGSEFDEGSGAYWSTTTDPFHLNSALSYIPERPWNEAKGADATSTAASGLSGLWSGSGGISAYYLQPPWQRGPGVPSTDPTLTGGDWVTSVNLTNSGSGYISAPTATFSGGGCTQEPAATTILSGGSVTAINFNYGAQGGTLQHGQGIGCTSAPTVTFSAAPAGGTTATATTAIGPMQNIPPLVSGVPHRYTPDLSLNAASDHDGTLFCSEGVCEISSTGTLQDAGIVGGTSVAAPSMAGIQALIDQANGGRQGAPNYIYYALAAAQNTANCNSITPPLAASNCAFQDITTGDNLICGTSTCTATTGTKIGFLAGVGYDLATGLGSVNAANLSSQWSNVQFNSSTTTLGLSQTTAIAQGGPVTFSGTVTAGSGTGTPTGDVAFILSQGAFGQTVNVNTGAWSGPSPFATLDGGGNFTASLNNLPAGNYTVTARYGGDENFGSSLSAPVAVSVGTGNSTVTITPAYLNGSACTLTNTNSFTYGQLAWIPAAVTSNSGAGVPTGTVTFTVDGVPYAAEKLDSNGNGYLVAGAIASSSCIYDYIFAQSPTLTGGIHVIGASYSGDSTFSAATAAPVTISVAPLTVTPTLAAGATLINSGFGDQLTATLTSSALTGISPQSSGPTGTVTFTDTTTSTVLGTASVVPTVSFSGNTYTFAATAALSTTGITQTGANAITATYSGDNNFSAATSAAVTVTVSTGTATTTTVTSSSNPTTLNGRPTFTATLSGGPTSGTVTFYDGSTVLGTGAVGAAHTATFRPASGAAFWAGTHNITATYGGAATFLASSSPVLVETVTKGTTTIALTAKTVGLYGQTYTFAAVLTPSSTNATYAPNQSTVQFFDGAANIGSAQPITITSSQGGYGLWTAVLTVSNLSPGTHSITAQYSDLNYSLSTSNTQSVFVGSNPTITWPAPAAITYPTPLGATQLDATDNIPGYFVYSPAAGAVLNAGSQTLSVTFYPADSLDFPTQTKTVKIQVLHATPVITWANPSNISYGTPLGGTQLDATAAFNGNPVAGNFVYTPGAGTVLNASPSPQTLSVTFTPSSNNYATVAQTATILVTPATPTVIWANPANITYGTPLGATQLDATATFNGNPVLGNFVYTPPAGTLLNASPSLQTLSVTFTPYDSTDFNPVTQTASILVGQATPYLFWPTPGDITYGTPLGAAQLDAQACTGPGSGDTIRQRGSRQVRSSLIPSCPGTAVMGGFTYTPAANTVLGAGLGQTLSVLFTPTDATDYTTATDSVQINVAPAVLTVTATSTSATYGQAPPVLGYTITGFVNSDPPTVVSGAPSESTVSTTSTPGVYGIAIAQGTLAAANYSFSFVAGSLNLQQAGSTTVLTAVSSSIYANQTTTLTATVSITGSGAGPTGTVIFYNGTTPLGLPVTLTALDATDATATLSLSGSQLALGSNSLTAVYSGDVNYLTSPSSAFVETLLSNQVSFGEIGVGTPAPVQTLTYNFTGPTTLTAVNILTAGASGPDYSDGGGSTCTAGTTYGVTLPQSCVVTVAFKPSAPGQRSGGVTLFAQGATLPLQTWYLSGDGQSSAVTIDPGTQTTLTTLGNSGQAYGSAIDGAGNLYLVDHANSAVIELAAGTFAPTTVVSSGLLNPTAVALDGAGNLYISDTGNNRVVVVPDEQGTLNVADLSVVAISGLGSPRGIALDGGGNLYVADATHGNVVEVAAGGGAPSNVATGLTAPHGVAVDALGNVYVTSNNQVSQYPVGGGSAIPYGTGYNNPRGIAVDASGTVYVADSGNNQIVVVAPGGGSQTNGSTLPATSPQGVMVDAAANLYVTVGGSMYEVNRSLAATLTFAGTNIGSTSAAQVVSVTDAGNQGLNVSNLVVSANFTQLASGGTDCSASTALGAAGQCLIAVAFAPTASGTLPGSVTLTDNALNNLASSQAVQLSGTGALDPQTITFPAIGNQTYGVAPITLGATASSGLTVSYTVTLGPATVNGNVLTITGAGSVTVLASQAGDGVTWAPATSVPQTITVSQEGQTITFTNPGAQAFGTSLTLSASSSSNLPVSFVTMTPSPVCTVTGNTVTFLNVGYCTVQATQAGNANYLPATPVPQTFKVNQGTQIITFATIPATTLLTGSFTLSPIPSVNTGLPLTTSTNTPGICSIAGDTVTLLATGNCGIIVTQVGTAQYAAASLGHLFAVTLAAQTITFPPIGSQVAGTSFALQATASSGLPVSFTPQTPSICSVTGNTTTGFTANLLVAGTCGIYANQAGNTTYAAAPQAGHAFLVTLHPQTITFSNPGTQVLGAAFSLTSYATASSGLPVTFTTTTPSICAVSGNTATGFTATMAAVGTCDLYANQAGNTTYAAASQVGHAFVVTLVPQTITFSNPGTQVLGAAFSLTSYATASSGLPVTFTTTTPSICAVSGNTATGFTATMAAVGTCDLYANQAGNTTYAAAPQVGHAFVVIP